VSEVLVSRLLARIDETEQQVRALYPHLKSVLGMCRAHRDLIALHQRDHALVWNVETQVHDEIPFCRRCAPGPREATEEHFVWPCEELRILARGLGVEETD
jgi:glucose dehydrogenase